MIRKKWAPGFSEKVVLKKIIQRASGKERDLLGLAHAPDRRQRVGGGCPWPLQDSAGEERRAE
jgi:hypothetical protein